MKLKFKITKEDYIKFCIYHRENSRAYKNKFFLYKYLGAIIIYAIIVLMVKVILGYFYLYLNFIPLIVSIFWVISSKTNYRKMIEKEIKIIDKEGDNSFLLGEKTLLIDETDIKVFDNNLIESLSRQNIKNIKVYDDMIIIYISSYRAFIVPSRDLDYVTREKFINKLGLYQYKIHKLQGQKTM